MTDYKEENSYSNILKRITAFGGVQAFNILTALARGKFVAIFLGVEGMGVSTLYSSSTATIQQISSLGLNLAIVKEVAASKGDSGKGGRIMQTAIRMVLATALLGALVCALLAPVWSRLTFGNGDETASYVWLGLFVALSTAGAGYLALLQGMGEVKRLSKSSVVGGVAGLVCGVPLYWLFGVRGIVPAMIILALCTFLFYYISYRKACAGGDTREKGKLRFAEMRPVAARLISMGFILLVASMAGTLVSYLINLYIRSRGSVDDVGLFQAANSITNQYVGLIFSALALDYFPRLSAICHDRKMLREVVNRQTEIVMYVATPLIIALILTAPLIIRVLFTKDFMPIMPLMRWMGFGMLVQALAFPLGYIYVARDDRKVYLAMECVWANICWLGCSLLFYHIYGLIGLGISLVARGVIDFIINCAICARRYGFTYSARTRGAAAASLLLCGGCFAASLTDAAWSYPVMGTLLAISAAYSFIRLRKGIRERG